jgi:hypothetical protein
MKLNVTSAQATSLSQFAALQLNVVECCVITTSLTGLKGHSEATHGSAGRAPAAAAAAAM